MGGLSEVYAQVATWVAHMVSTVGGWLAVFLMVAAAVWIVRLEARVRRLEADARRQPGPGSR